MITIALPWPPTVNSLYPSNKAGRRFLSKKGAQYLKSVRLAAAACGAGLHGKTMTGRLAYRLSLWPPDRRIRDLSNHQKAVEDCLTKCGVWEDDSLVDHLEVDRMPIVRGGHCRIEIWSLDHECRPEVIA